MNTYNLTLLVTGIDENRLDDIYDATDGAANVEMGDRWTSTVGFDIEADTFADAVLRAINEVEKVSGLSVVRVEPDQLVWASEIADRIGRTRQSVDQLIKGQRGPGGFPARFLGMSGTRFGDGSRSRRGSRLRAPRDRRGAASCRRGDQWGARGKAQSARQTRQRFDHETGGIDQLLTLVIQPSMV